MNKNPENISEKISEKIPDRFPDLIGEISRDPRTLQMKDFVQHGKVTTYDHCLSVARASYRLGKLLHLKMSEEELVRGAFLHDYYLYDWHHHDGRWHGLTHPDEAARKAEQDFSLTPKEKNIIESHMWPLTPLKLPRSKEAALVCIADKACSLKETLLRRM